MTDTKRLAALEAVAEAAFAWWRRGPDDEWKREQALGAALKRLAALDALPAPAAAGETVTLGLIRARLSGAWGATQQPEREDPRDWEWVANITFTPPRTAPLPTITATVEPTP